MKKWCIQRNMLQPRIKKRGYQNKNTRHIKLIVVFSFTLDDDAVFN
jgi:hypothetical protein